MICRLILSLSPATHADAIIPPSAKTHNLNPVRKKESERKKNSLNEAYATMITIKEWITDGISYHRRKTLEAKHRARIQTPGTVHSLNQVIDTELQKYCPRSRKAGDFFIEY